MASTNQHHTVLSEGQIVRKAITRFNRDCRSDGVLPCEPSIHRSEVVEDVAILRNLNGKLASYRITPYLRLRQIRSVRC